jgi:quercetin dioxygenase-like cupin family protein
MGYKPSPRPSFDAPAVLRADEVVRHTWGDAEAGFVEDWIYVSSQLIHAIIFGMPPGGKFTHSESFRTIFGADELLHVLQGTLVLANPATGEIVRAEPGESVFFRRDTWHHGFSYGDEALRVLEFFAPPPATGTSGPYAQAQPYLDVSRYSDDRILGNLLDAARNELCVDSTQGPGARSHSFTVLRRQDAVLRLDTGVLVGLLVSSEHLTVGTVTVNGGQESREESHVGEEILYATRGALQVEAGGVEATLAPGDGFLIPAGTPHRYGAEGDRVAEGIFGVAPSYTVSAG